MTEFLDEKRKEIESRIHELRPLVDELHQLEKAAAALAGISNEGASSSATRRPSSGRGRKSGGAPRGRPRGSGKRAFQAQELVAANPGITIRELADAMGIQVHYLYRLLPSLQGDGKIRKEGKGWHPADQSAVQVDGPRGADESGRLKRANASHNSSRAGPGSTTPP